MQVELRNVEQVSTGSRAIRQLGRRTYPPAQVTAGLLEEAESAQRNCDTMSRLGFAQQIKSLTLPTEMGERFKVIGLQKNLHIDIQALTTGL
jgi:SAM-dependent MidA family methyltransferase